METSLIDYHGLQAVAVRAADGACALVTLQGAQVVSWIPAASGAEQLYVSPSSAFAPGLAIPGGVPAVFPQCSNRGALVRHGFARTMLWELLNPSVHKDGARITLRLTDDAQSRAAWPHAFVLPLVVRVAADDLWMELSCHNPGAAELQFSCALHTYLRVPDVAQAQVRGLGGGAYWDAVDGANKIQALELLSVDGELDRVYAGVQQSLQVAARDRMQSGILQVAQTGFQDVVVWNPGAARAAALADLPYDGYRSMLCIEAARISNPVCLQAGEHWAGLQHLARRR